MPDPSPFTSLARHAPTSTSSKRHLLAISRSIEARALAAGPGAQLWVCLQSVQFHSGPTLEVHRELARKKVRIAVYGADVRDGLARDTSIELHDVSPRGLLALEWNVLLVTRDLGIGLAARLADPAAPREADNDLDTRYDWVVSEDRDDVRYAASSLPAADFVLAGELRTNALAPET